MREKNSIRGLKSPRPCKLGTIPALVDLHGADARSLAPGKWVRVREWGGQPWFQVRVTEVQPDGYFKADR